MSTTDTTSTTSAPAADEPTSAPAAAPAAAPSIAEQIVTALGEINTRPTSAEKRTEQKAAAAAAVAVLVRGVRTNARRDLYVDIDMDAVHPALWSTVRDAVLNSPFGVDPMVAMRDRFTAAVRTWAATCAAANALGIVLPDAVEPPTAEEIAAARAALEKTGRTTSPTGDRVRNDVPRPNVLPAGSYSIRHANGAVSVATSDGATAGLTYNGQTLSVSAAAVAAGQRDGGLTTKSANGWITWHIGTDGTGALINTLPAS